jgi:23S rRNA pseudouridine1911/1915/1917 synthase
MSETVAPEEGSDQELYEHYRFIADPGQAIIRLDRFLTDRLPRASRNQIQIATKEGHVQVNGLVVKPSRKVKPGDEVRIVLPYPVPDYELIPEDIPLEILYEDDDVVVLNKQAGLVVHPGVGNKSGTLVNGLIYHFGKLPSAEGQPEPRPGLVHRLDKDTTGVMVVGKNEYALSNLAMQFFHRTTDRLYNAICWGDPEEDEGTIVGNVGRSLKDRKLMHVFEDGSQGKHAVTHYRVLERFRYVSLVECKLETGRTHQIRVHMAWKKHPLFNDAHYGGDRMVKGTSFSKYKQFVDNCFKELPRQALHARTLAFDHPVTKERMSFESPLPQDMQVVLEKWRNYVVPESW